MMGLRAENDHASSSFFSSANNRKTYRFAESYSGRFCVSGVSVSFQKYTKQKQETDSKYLKNDKQEKKYTYEPLLEKHQKEELRRDAQRLLEMEEQLKKLQKMRELKRQRDRARRKKKMEYNAARTIQNSFQRYVTRKSDGAVDKIVFFLRWVTVHLYLRTCIVWCSIIFNVVAPYADAFTNTNFFNYNATYDTEWPRPSKHCPLQFGRVQWSKSSLWRYSYCI